MLDDLTCFRLESTNRSGTIVRAEDLCNPQSIQAAASKLISSLFYIELATLPRFYTSPQKCTLRVLCRLQPGEALRQLLGKLVRERALLMYQGDDTHAHKERFCTEDVLRRCSSGQPFSRSFVVHALSPDTRIAVGLNYTDGRTLSLSKCPYRLKDLVADQDLGSSVPENAVSPSPSVPAEEPRGLQVTKRLDELIQTIKLLI